MSDKTSEVVQGNKIMQCYLLGSQSGIEIVSYPIDVVPTAHIGEKLFKLNGAVYDVNNRDCNGDIVDSVCSKIAKLCENGCKHLSHNHVDEKREYRDTVRRRNRRILNGIDPSEVIAVIV